MNTRDKIDLPPNPITPMLAALIDKASGAGTAETVWQLMQEFAYQAIEADRKTTERQLTAYRGLVNSLEARLAHLQAQHDELKKSNNPELLASERAANAILTAELEADRKRRGEPVAWPTHEFAIVVDRMYEGEGPSLAMWNGENYQFSDGDCYDRETDGSLDGYTAEWLTHHQLEQRLFAPQPAEPVKVPSADAIADIVRDHLTAAYICNRVWEAWSYNTMGPDDFIEASETEMADEIAAAIVARYGQPAQPAASIKDDAFAAYQAGRAALLAERDALVHDNAEYVGAASALATENQQLREALTKVRQVIAADRQALLDTHGNGTEIPATDELGSLALYDYDGALHTIDAALAQGEV